MPTRVDGWVSIGEARWDRLAARHPDVDLTYFGPGMWCSAVLNGLGPPGATALLAMDQDCHTALKAAYEIGGEAAAVRLFDALAAELPEP